MKKYKVWCEHWYFCGPEKVGEFTSKRAATAFAKQYEKDYPRDHINRQGNIWVTIDGGVA